LFQDFIVFRETVDFVLAEYLVSIDHDVEDSAFAFNQFRINAGFRFDCFRQTDGCRFVVSLHAESN